MKRLDFGILPLLLSIVVSFSSCDKDEQEDNPETLVWTIYNKENSEIVGENVLGICLENDSGIWVATENGASKFDGIAWTNYTQNNSGLADYLVNSVAVDRQNRKWFGGVNTISVLNDAIWNHYGESIIPNYYFLYALILQLIILTTNGLLLLAVY